MLSVIGQVNRGQSFDVVVDLKRNSTSSPCTTVRLPLVGPLEVFLTFVLVECLPGSAKTVQGRAVLRYLPNHFRMVIRFTPRC